MIDSSDRHALYRARQWCLELIERARPTGPMAGLAHRASLCTAAWRLLGEIDTIRADAGFPTPTPFEDTAPVDVKEEQDGSPAD